MSGEGLWLSLDAEWGACDHKPIMFLRPRCSEGLVAGVKAGELVPVVPQCWGALVAGRGVQGTTAKA